MKTLQSRGLVPFLSPMLEDEPGATKDSELNMYQINFNKIQNCIEYVSKHIPEDERAIAIKLTAFIPIHQLVTIYQVIMLENTCLNVDLIYSKNWDKPTV